MTKFFLHGGRVGTISRENENFFSSMLEEMVETSNSITIQILIIPFARDSSRWKQKFEEIQEIFISIAKGKKLEFHLADENITHLGEQIFGADILFFLGGDTVKLQRSLEKISDFKSLIREKIVGGSSAGALVFSKYYYENDTDTYHAGLGFFPFGMICHWKNQYEQLENIKKYGGVERVVCIQEGTFQREEN